MLPSPFVCGLGSRVHLFSRPLRVHSHYGPVTRDLPKGDLVDGLQKSLVSLHPAIQATGRLTFAPAGLTPAEHTSLRWTHKRTQLFRLVLNELPDHQAEETR